VWCSVKNKHRDNFTSFPLPLPLPLPFTFYVQWLGRRNVLTGAHSFSIMHLLCAFGEKIM